MESNIAVKSETKFSCKNYDTGQSTQMVTYYKYSNKCTFYETFSKLKSPYMLIKYKLVAELG